MPNCCRDLQQLGMLLEGIPLLERIAPAALSTDRRCRSRARPRTSHPSCMDAAHAVRAARRRALLSQRELAAQAGVSLRTVAAIEAGRTSPSWRTMSALLAAVGLEPPVVGWDVPARA
jgi:DNA-binding XRE family transcriptional regulator